MERTENVFEITSNFILKIDGSRVIMHCPSNKAWISTGSIQLLKEVVDQFLETGTFIKPPRYSVVTGVGGFYLVCKDGYNVIKRPTCDGSEMVWYKSREAAQHVCDALNAAADQEYLNDSD